MDLYDAIQNRRTVRDFTDQEVSEDVLLRILDAGLRAPTNDHMRSWEFIVIRDRRQIARILSVIPKNVSRENLESIFRAWNIGDECQKSMYSDGIPKQFSMLAASGCLVLPLYRQHGDLMKPDSLSQLNGFASVWCCVENMLLAAAAEGLGTALRIPFAKDSEQILEVTGHPGEYVVPCLLAFGYPSPDAPVIRQFTPDVRSRIHREQW